MGWFSNFFRKFKYNGGGRSFMFTGGGFSFTREELETIIENGYLSNPDVYAIIKKIADVGSDIPLKVYRNEGGQWEEIEDSELLEVIKKPNRNQTTQEFIEECIIQLLNTGNVYILKTQAIGFEDASGLSMEVLPSGMVTIQTNEDLSIKNYVYDYARTKTYEPDQIIHIKYIDPSQRGKEEHYGLSPLQAACLTLEGSNNSHDASAQLLKNKGISGLLSTDGDVQASPEMAKLMQMQIQQQIDGTNSYGKIPVSSVPMKYVQTGMSPTDLKIMELNTQRLRTLCAVFGMDSSLFNDPQNKTYSNRTEAKKDMYTSAVIPVVNKILTGLNKDLIEEDDTAIRPDTSGIEALQKDKKMQAETAKIYVDAGILTIDEVREDMGRSPMPITNDEEDEEDQED